MSRERSVSFFKFPNIVTADDILKCSKNNKNIEALYWTLLEFNETDEFIPVLRNGNGEYLISKMLNKKVVISSLILDWQRHDKLLENILINLIIPDSAIAFITNNETPGLGYSFFLKSLENHKLYYKIYNSNIKDDIERLKECVNIGIINTVLVLGKECKKVIEKDINKFVKDHGTKVIELYDRDISQNDSYVVHTTDKKYETNFADLEFRIQHALFNGYINNSFSTTIEVLKVLNYFKNSGDVKGTYDSVSLKPILDKVGNKIIKDGSFDKTMGATCKALWLFKNFSNDEECINICKSWISTQDINCFGLREKLEIYITLSIFDENPKEYLTKKCKPLVDNIFKDKCTQLSEYDIPMICDALVKMQDMDLFKEFIDFMSAKINDGDSLTRYTLSNVFSKLIEIYYIIEKQKNRSQKFIDKIRNLLFDIDAMLESTLNEPFIDICEEIQIVAALYKFESFISFPVKELTNILYSDGSIPTKKYIFKTNITNFEKARIERDKLQKESEENKIKLKNYNLLSTIVLISLMIAVAAIYIAINEAITIANAGINPKMSFLDLVNKYWPMVVSVAIMPFLKMGGKKLWKIIKK